MKVTAFIGGGRRNKLTYHTTEQFLHSLHSRGDVESEIVMISDYKLGTCTGCKVCFEKGEEFCPLQDDRDILIDKMLHSDGVIFASPNYSFHVSAVMKIFLDRLGYVFHRPCFFGKAFSSIVVQGIYGGEKIAHYFDFIGTGLGFNVVKGCCLTALEPMTEKDHMRFTKAIDQHSKNYYSVLTKKEYPIPSIFKLMIFRSARTSIKLLLNEGNRDYSYYRDKGWFESDYYYPTQLNPLKRMVGNFFDRMEARKTTRNK